LLRVFEEPFELIDSAGAQVFHSLLQQMFDGAPSLPIGDRQLLLAIAIRGESPYSGPVRLIAAICSLAMCCPMTGGSGSSSTGVTDEELGHALDHPVGPPFATRTQWAGPGPSTVRETAPDRHAPEH
jgi:hypothetical protein